MKALKKFLKRVVSLAIFAGLAYGGWYGYQLYTAEEEDTGLGTVPTGIAEVRDIIVTVSATGVLRPVKIVQVKSKASGEILNMPVELGDYVRAGDLIAQIDTETVEQELAQAQADLESARTRMDVSERQYQRAQDLQEQDLVSIADLETSEQNYATAKAALLRAEAELKLRQERLDDATVTAPTSGRIILKDVEEGMIIQSSVNNVSGGTNLVEMADLSTLEVRTLVDEIDIGRVQPGLPVESTVEAFPDRQFDGQVIKIEPQAVVEQQVTTFPVLSYIDNSEGLLLPGMNADVDIVIHERPRVLSVPNEAVRTTADAGQVAALLGIDYDGGGISETGQQLVAEARSNGGRPGPGRFAAAPDGGDGQRPGAAGPVADAGSRPEGRASFDRTSDRAPGSEGDAGPASANGSPGTNGHGNDANGDRAAEQRLDDVDAQGEGDGEELTAEKLRSMSQAERREALQNLSEEDRNKLIQQMRASGGFGGGQRGGGQTAQSGSSGGGAPGGGDAEGGRAPTVSMDAFGIGKDPEVAVVFVRDAEGLMTARSVAIGVRDWEFTEVFGGLRPGEEVVILPSTSLLMSQEALRERFSRFSRLPGTGGGRR